MRSKKRVRVHLKQDLPSVEGLLQSRNRDEFVIVAGGLLVNPQSDPAELTSRELRIPRENVAFYEVL